MKRESNVLCAAEQFKILEEIKNKHTADNCNEKNFKDKFMDIRNVALSLLDKIDALEEVRIFKCS